MNGMTVWQPKTGEQVTDIVISALTERRKLSVSGHETKAGLGHPVDAKESLSLKNLSGIVDYQPEELVLVVKAGTPLDEIEKTLFEKNQMLAFEPPHLERFTERKAQARLEVLQRPTCLARVVYQLVLRVIFCLALQRYLEGEMCLNLAAV